MSDYTQITDYSAKDALTTGDPEKIILGSDVDNDLDAIATAILSKYDSSDLASAAQAIAASLNTVLMTPGRMVDWADGNAGASGAGMVGDIWRLADVNADRILFWDDSAGAVAQLAVDGTELVITTTNFTIGQLASSKLSGALPAISGAALTSLTAANITGANTLPDGVLSTNVPLKNASNTFTGATQTVSAAASAINLTSTGASASRVRFDTSSTVRGYMGAEVAASLITGAAVGDLIIRAESGGLFFSGNAGTTAHLALSSAGVVTTPNASAGEVGYKGALSKAWNSSSDNPVLADAGKSFDLASAGTLTIPANASVAFPVGTIIILVGRSGSTNTIAITTDTLYLAGTAFGTTGSRTLASGGMATLIKITSTAWMISGQGLT